MFAKAYHLLSPFSKSWGTSLQHVLLCANELATRTSCKPRQDTHISILPTTRYPLFTMARASGRTSFTYHTGLIGRSQLNLSWLTSMYTRLNQLYWLCTVLQLWFWNKDWNLTVLWHRHLLIQCLINDMRWWTHHYKNLIKPQRMKRYSLNCLTFYLEEKSNTFSQ